MEGTPEVGLTKSISQDLRSDDGNAGILPAAAKMAALPGA